MEQEVTEYGQNVTFLAVCAPMLSSSGLMQLSCCLVIYVIIHLTPSRRVSMTVSLSYYSKKRSYYLPPIRASMSLCGHR